MGPSTTDMPCNYGAGYIIKRTDDIAILIYDTANDIMYKRQKTSGTWRDWKTLITNGDLQTTYDSSSTQYATDLLTIPFGKMYKYSPDTLNIPVSGQYGVAFKFGNDVGRPTSGQWEYIVAYSTSNPARTYINRKINNSDLWSGWDVFITNSDLGIVIKNSGTVAAVKNSDVQIATITLPANHKYLVLAHTQTSIGDANAIMSCAIKGISGTSNSTVGFRISRATMNSGGGCASWGVINTATSCIYGVYGYGYSSMEYNYIGDICAIQLS